MTFQALPLKDKAKAVIIGIISLWIAIELIPTINDIILRYVQTKFFVGLISITAVYLLAIWIFPWIMFKIIYLVTKR